MTPEISVITPVYGVEKYIEKCLRSLFTQTMVEGVEFIIVNDSTKDASMEIARRVIAEYPEVDVKIVEHERNMGYSVALQTGMDAATGEYTIYVDSDDWVEPAMLERLWAAARRDDADIVVCDYFVDYPKGRRYVAQPVPATGVETLGLLLRHKIHGSLCNKLVRRSLYTDNGIRTLPGLNYMEDFLLYTKLFPVARRISYLPEAFLHYVQRPGAMTARDGGIKGVVAAVIFRVRPLTWLYCRIKK
jgi:glycosyltransferase involved in cell wall biosynthesis